MELATFIGALSALALSVTTSVYILRSIVDKNGTRPAVVWNVVALAVGVAYCAGWQIDVTAQALHLVPALASHSSRLTGVAGQVLTGLTAGALSGFWHEVMDALRGLAGKSPRLVSSPPAEPPA